MASFAQNLKNLRISRHLTQKELAQRLSLTSSVISAYENNIRMPSYDVLFQLASVFHCSCDYLLGYADDEKALPSKYIDVSDLTDRQIQALLYLADTFRNPS